MTEPFGARLDAALSARGSLCVGIDPHPALLAAWGLTDDVTMQRLEVDNDIGKFGHVAASISHKGHRGHKGKRNLGLYPWCP